MPKQPLKRAGPCCGCQWAPEWAPAGATPPGTPCIPTEHRAGLSITDILNPPLQPQLPLQHQQQTHEEYIYSLTPGQHIPDSGHAQITTYMLRSRNTNISLKCKISEHGNSSPCHMISTEIAGE